MKLSDKLKVEMSQGRARMLELSGKTDATEEERSEMNALREGSEALEERYQAAITAEAEEDRQAAAAGDVETDAEAKERWEIRQRASIGRYMDRAANQRALDGAERELNAALEIHGDRLPLNMLLEPVENRGDGEDRADTATALTVNTITRPEMWLRRVFEATASEFLGVTRRSVPDGQTSLPVVKSGATAETKSKGSAKDAEAFNLGVEEMNPQRLTARYVFSLEDAARLGRATYEDALRNDLRMALSSAADNEIINGKGSLISGLLSLTRTLIEGGSDAAMSDATTGRELLDGILAGIDGKYASEPADLRFIANPAFYAFMHTLPMPLANNSAILVTNLMAESRIQAKASAHIVEINNQAGESSLIISRAMGLAGAAVHGVWDALQVIRDPYSDAASGKVAVTVCMLHDFQIVRGDNFLVRRVAKS